MRTQVAALLIAGLSLFARAGHAEEPATVLLGADTPELADPLVRAFEQVDRRVQRAALQLDEVMLAVECTTLEPACLQRIGKSLKAAALVVVEVSGAGAGRRVALRWFDVASGKDQGRSTIDWPEKMEAGPQAELLLRAARELFGVRPQAPAPGREPTGGLSITASVPYAEVSVDGQPRGVAPLELRNLPVGRYRVEARREGYLTWQGTVEVAAERLTPLEIEMVAEAASVRAAPAFFDTIRLRTWIVAGVGAACLAGAIAFGAHMRAQQQELDERQGVTFEEIDEMQDLRDSGERDALAANILFGIGGAALAASAVLAYLDYWRSRPERRLTSAVAPPRVAAGPRSLMLRLSF